MRQWIGLRHVERIVGSDKDVIGAARLNQRGKLVSCKDHAVDVDFLEIVGWRVRQVAATVGACAPHVVHAAGICAQIPSAVNGENLQIGMPLEHAVEDEIMQSQRRLEGIADHIVELEAGKTLAFGKPIRMDDDEGSEFFGLGPEGGERRVRQLAPGDI